MRVRLYLLAATLGPALHAAGLLELDFGFCYDYVSNIVPALAAKVAWDEGYFDDVLQASGFHRNVTVTVRPVYGQCMGSVALRQSLPLLLGQGEEQGQIYSANASMGPVLGIAGCTCSSSSLQVSNLAATYLVPIVSGASTSPQLSDKAQHPYFSRVVPPDDMQASAVVALIHAFRWRRVFSICRAEPYAQGINEAIQNRLPSESGADVDFLVYQVPADNLRIAATAKTWDRQPLMRVAQRIARETPEPRVFFVGSDQIDYIARVFQELGFVGSATAWLASDGCCSLDTVLWIANRFSQYRAVVPDDPWWDYPWSETAKNLRGMLCTMSQHVGPKFSGSRFRGFLGQLTRDKILKAGGSVADQAWQDVWLTAAAWEANFYRPLYFDSLSVLLLAVGAMLGRGLPLSAIRGQALLQEVRASHIEGISGMIAFDANGDRLASYVLYNMIWRDGQATLDSIGLYDSLGDALSWTSPPIFADGTTKVPLDRPAPCPLGFSYADILRGCTACPAGRYMDERASACEDCLPGSFANSTGMAACQPAPPGAFVSGARSTTLSECPAGTFTAQAGETECRQCSSGSYQAGTGATSCETCERGYYLLDGACKACGPFETTDGPGATASKACKLGGGGVGFAVACGFAGLLVCIVSFAVVRSTWRRMRVYEQERERHIQETIHAGLLTVQELGHPMIVIHAADFLALTWQQLGGLHEGLRNSGQLIVLDTLEHVRQAKAAGMRVVFFSYQWLSWERCGPSELQFNWMKTAALNYAAMGKGGLNHIYVWLDVLAIPQCHPGIKQLAVNSLYTYATAADTLIIIAPEAEHFNTGAVANLATYNSRAWTRAEQVAYLSCHDLSCMFIATAHGLEPVSEGWLEGIVCIFEAEMTCCRKLHDGATRCDKESLVIPMLGLWYTLSTTVKDQQMVSRKHASGCAALYSLMQPQLDRVFPRTFDFVTREGREPRTLFGDCVHRVDALVRGDNARSRLRLETSKDAGAATADVRPTFSI